MYAPLLRPEEVDHYNRFKTLVEQARSKSEAAEIFESITYAQESYLPLTILSTLIHAFPGFLHPFRMMQKHSKAWNLLPEPAKAGHASENAQWLMDSTSEQCKHSYTSLVDLMHPESQDVAITDPESGRSLPHKELVQTVRHFSLPLTTVPGRPKPVVAISLPNGPLLAITVLATTTYYTAAPVTHGNGVGAAQFKADVLQSKSSMVLAAAADVERLRLRDSWLAEAGIRVLLVDLSKDMQLVIRDLDGNLLPNTFESSPPSPNKADDTGILLFTSGTSGTKKLVPLSIHSMVCGIAMVIDSWGLSPSMRCLNQMPLNHVGGLIRNLFAPIMSGGSIICCSAFDANLFWDCVEDYAPTWYYASPSMRE
jgi:acyl-coenzyme A synthetase/AMP-(fatty) acid ligase